VFVCLVNFFFQALFSQSLFLSRRGHFQELQLKSDLFDSDQNWTVARLNDFQKKTRRELDNSKTFFTESHFRAISVPPLRIFLANLKMLCNF